ncbi:MAG: cell division protein FtsZ [Methanobacteriota archaeon]|nr:MAG: cell division protein FtsZ [Euryarchaeota archaeon]
MPTKEDSRAPASAKLRVVDPSDGAQTPSDREIEEVAKNLDLSIKVIGCGGAGSNTVDRCVKSGLREVFLCAVNTDSKHLLKVKAHKKLLIGRSLTKGLGAGARPEIGEKAALESEDDIRACVSQANIVFVTAGMGGGTGTSAAQVASRLAKSSGSLTVGVVTLPFKSEGELRMTNAMAGLGKLARVCDTTIVIPNDVLLELVPRLPVEAAFTVADELLVQTISGLTEMLKESGLVNVDFADLKTILIEGGLSLIGVGESSLRTEERLEDAVAEALDSPLLGKMDLKGAKGALVRIVGGPDMSIEEAARAAEMVTERINPDGRLIWGCSVRREMEGLVRVLIIVTGAQSKYVLLREGEDPVMYPTNVDYRGRLNIPSSQTGEDEDSSMFIR